MSPTLSPLMAADYLIARSGGGLTALQVIKLAYMAHGYSLAILDEALLGEAIETWRYGPVVPSVYYAARRHGGRPIGELLYSGIPAGDAGAAEKAAAFISGRMSAQQRAVLDGVLDSYGAFTGFELTDMTCPRGAPWDRYYGPRAHGREIPDHVIRSYYRDLIGRDGRCGA